ncbi:WXG100-like domain-containing protein, partial [[Kitasatospora] papulosa]
MSIQVSPEVNAMIFILTGERLMDADEDLAYESRRPYSGLGRKLDRLSSLIDKSVHDIGESMPDDLAKSYSKAMGMLIDDGGKNYLRDFAEQLDKIAEGRRKTSMDIMESKWQVIAEIIRLLIEIAIYLAMSFFTGGASASQIMLAKMRSRFFILTTLSHLLQRLHLAPSLTEAFAEAFTTFAVRMAMMNFAPDGRRPDGIDWSDIGKAAAFGAAAGFLTSVFDKFARGIVKSFDNNFLKNPPDLDFKSPPNPKNTPDLDLPNDRPNPRPTPEPSPKPDRDSLFDDRPGPYGNGPGPSSNLPVTFRNNPLSFRNNPELWRNNQILRFNADRPGALAGHYGLKGTADFLAAGSGEALAEILIKGAFDGDWSTSWSTFVGAGISSQVEATLSDTAVNSAAELRHVIDKLRNPPPTVSGGTTGSDDGASRSAGGRDRTDGPSRPDTTGGDGPTPTSITPVSQQTTGPGTATGSQSPPPYVSENPPPYVSENPPPYTSLDPPPYSPGPLPVTATENALWQQVHQGPAEVREQALRDLAALRGSQPPGSSEIGVRDSLHGNLSQLPEVRVVPAGGSPANQIDTDEVRRALDGFGTQVTVDAPIAAGATPGAVDGPGALGPTPGAVDGPGAVNGPGTSGTNAGNSAARPTGDNADLVVDHGVDAAPEHVENGPGAAPGTSPENATVDVPVDSAVTSPTPEGNTQGSPESNAQGAPEGTTEGAPESELQTSPGEAAGRNDDTAAVPGVQGNATPVATGGSPTASTTPATGSGARPGGVPTAGGSPTSSAPSPQGTRAPEGAAPVDGSPTTTDDSPQSTPVPETVDPNMPEATTDPDVTTSPGANVSAAVGDSTTVDAPTAPAAGPTTDTTPGLAADTVTAPPKVSTVGSFADSGDVRDVSGTTDVKSDPTRAVDPASTTAPPLTIVVSQVPPPGEGSPEAAELLDGAGTDRAVVLGPAVTPDGTGRPVRAAVELTREGPGAPVQVRTLTGPTPAATADGTVDTAFPGADVLLPLADALGPMPRPVTESTTDTDAAVTSTPTPPPTGPTEKVDPAHGDPVARDSTPPASSAADKLATLSRPWSEPATDVYLEAGDSDSAGSGGRAPGQGTGHGPGSGGTPPPLAPVTAETSPTAQPVVLPPPQARIVVRPVSGAASGDTDGDGTGRPTDEPAVVTLDGITVPLAQLRRLVPDTAVQTQPGRAVRTLTISQSPAEDGTRRDAGRRALLGQETFRGVRTVSDDGSPASTPRAGTDPAAGTEAQQSSPRTVFTGPPAPLPGADTERGADYFVTHGTPRTVTLGTDDSALPSVKMSGVQLGEVLKSWAVDGDEDRPLVLYACETGQQPQIAGLPVAQHVANRTGRQVYAPTTEVGTARGRDGEVRAVLTEGADGPGRWRLFTPEPKGADLDRAARDAGLHAGPGPADPFARARTLQQIRTLRDVLGPDAEQRPENAELLAGLAYVDGLRWLNADSAARYGDGRMTPDLLRRMVTDWHTATGATTADPSADPTVEQYTAFLRAAAGLRAGAGPGTTLGDLLPPPPAQLSPTTSVSREDVRGLSYAPSADVAWSLSSAPLPLSELALGPEDTAELARRLSDPAPTTTGPQEQPTPEPPKAGEVDSYAARHTYGMAEKGFKEFRDLARDRNVVIDVRPTNPLAPKWLEAGALPKPSEIKAKTVNDVDVFLGADPSVVGLVGYFKPVLADVGVVPEGDRDRVLSRFNERSAEFHELAGQMAGLESENRFFVRDGVVYGTGRDGERRPLTGDHDVFDISTPDGERISLPAHDALIEEMRAKDMAVMHGAHMFWNPPTAFDKSLFDKIVGSHQGPDGRPLLRFSPGNNNAQLTWTAPLAAGEVDSYAARHTYGMAEKGFKEFRDLARDRNVVIDVRPTNPLAPKWLEAGALPKPSEIKAKTVNDVDVFLGADPSVVGLVGYFKPVLADVGVVPEGDRDRVLSRFNERSAEFHELAGQ